jgi:adenosylmethionine-8-amino-7-oxononanoate aminotransferase
MQNGVHDQGSFMTKDQNRAKPRQTRRKAPKTPAPKTPAPKTPAPKTPAPAKQNPAPDWHEAGLGHIWLPYTQMKAAGQPLAVEKTDGCRIVLADGRVLIDGIASWWTACHGYNHKHIRQAVAKQLELMPHIMFGGLVHEPALTLARRLAALLPGDLERVFFSESGSVAVEIALKMALQYWRNKGARGRTKFLSFQGGYHGDTFGAMAVSDPGTGFHAPAALEQVPSRLSRSARPRESGDPFVALDSRFRGNERNVPIQTESALFPQQIVVPLPRDEQTLEAFAQTLDAHAETLAAIIVEPLAQGAGGMRFHPPWVLARLRAAADRHGLLLIFDEIFTGFGRTGHLFACEAASVVPDIVTLGKALTGGTLPLAATVARRHVFEAFWSDDPAKALMHGPTYMANALACAAANASLDLFATGEWRAQVAAISAALKRDLGPCRDLPGVVDVRVLGAIGVVELSRIGGLEDLRRQFIERGVFVRPFGNVIYLTPAFTITPDELSRLTKAVVEVVKGGVF